MSSELGTWTGEGSCVHGLLEIESIRINFSGRNWNASAPCL